jgi:hypothetical protein
MIHRGLARFTRCFALAVLLVAPAACAADKTDVVEMRNGDRLTREIKELNQGRLMVKTDGMGTVYLEWGKVVRVSSPMTFHLQLVSGQHLFGTFLPAEEEGRVVIAAKTGPVNIELSKIAFIFPIRSTFWARFDTRTRGTF